MVIDTLHSFHERSRRVLDAVEPVVAMDVLVYTPAEWRDLTASRPFFARKVVAKGKVLYERAG